MRKDIKGLDFATLNTLKYHFRKLYAIDYASRVFCPKGYSYTPIEELPTDPPKSFVCIALLWDDARRDCGRVARDAIRKIMKNNEDIGEAEAEEIIAEIRREAEMWFNSDKELYEIY